ncbi:ER membrane protein complex subunit 4 [Ditylenchus destructor]|nr:ER membrane protein complex subunit 4 [Ditylenchus destructor]
MMYMAGNTISIFPIMMVVMMAWRPMKALMAVNAAFKPLEAEYNGSLILHKILFVLGNLGAIVLAVYKCHSMGLLPNHANVINKNVDGPRRTYNITVKPPIESRGRCLIPTVENRFFIRYKDFSESGRRDTRAKLLGRLSLPPATLSISSCPLKCPLNFICSRRRFLLFC